MDVECVMAEFARTQPLMDPKYTRLVAFDVQPTWDEVKKAFIAARTSNIDTSELVSCFRAWLKLCDRRSADEPLFLAICAENADEFLIRRIPKHVDTQHRWSYLTCEYSQMGDCMPRNKMAERKSSDDTQQYLFLVAHVSAC